MLTRAIIYHQEQLRSNQHVLDEDGNIFSDHHRAEASKKVSEHTAILAELTKANAPVNPLPALDTLTLMLGERVERIGRLGRMEDAAGPGVSRDMMLQDIRKMEPERTALEIAVKLLTEIAAQPVVKHRKGGAYTEYGRGILQTDVRLGDNAELVGYRDLETGRWFFRPPAEMDDGRFTPVDPATGDPVIEIKRKRPKPVLVKIDGLDDRKIEFSAAEITDIERGKTVTFSSRTTSDEDIWGSYKPTQVTYVGTDVAVVFLKML